MAAADGSRPGALASEPCTPAPLATLVYRSRATGPLCESELARLIRSAKVRNRAESLTGLVIYDRERFLQWLEGPAENLARVAESIRRDGRHCEIEVLSEHPSDERVFEGWDMQLALGPDRLDALHIPAIASPAELIYRMHRFPESAPGAMADLGPRIASPVTCDRRRRRSPAPMGPRLPDTGTARRRDTLDRLVGEMVLPELRSRHAVDTKVGRPLPSDPIARQLATLVGGRTAEGDPGASETLCRRTSASVEALADLFERTTRILGDGWRRERWSGIDVGIALCTMQGLFRRISPSLRLLEGSGGLHGSALVAPAPGETHVLGSVLKADLLTAQGWEVPRNFPASLEALETALAEERRDILVLSLSRAFRRDERMQALAETIARARRASRNPGLAVIVGGRIFRDEPGAWRKVGADAPCCTVSMIGVSVAEALKSAVTAGRSRVHALS